MNQFSAVLVFSALLLTAVTNCLADDVETPDLIMQNVRVAQSSADAEATIVNILISKRKIVLVSEDEVPADEQTIVKDASGGYLIGRIGIGSAADFIILDVNPAENIRVLANTEPHVKFAISDGVIIKNELGALAAQSTDSEAVVAEAPAPLKTSRWIAYTPPPFALSTSIDADKKWNAFDTKHVDGIVVSAVLLDRGNWVYQNSASEAQPGIGDLSTYDGGTIRGFRFGVGGTIKLKRPWVYSIGGAANAFDLGFDSDDTDSFTFFDFRLDIPMSDTMTLSVGKQKEPLSLERTMTLIQAPVQERTAAADAMMPSRNVGVVLSGMALDSRLTWATGLFNDWIENDESFSDSASQAVGRVTWLPTISDDESNLIHLGAGIRYTNAKQGLRYKSRPEVGNAPNFVDTQSFDADSSTLYSLEAAWRSGPYWVTAEYVSNHIDAPQLGNPTFSGYHIGGTWTLSGEMRPYNRRSGAIGSLPVAQNIHQGGYGAVELGARWSDVDLADGLVDGGYMQIATIGVSWWLSKIFSVSLNYESIWHDRTGSKGRADVLVTRVLLSTD
jgi:phosphate-selective porin OprO/OprP